MSKGRVAILVENDYQDQEVWVPLYRLREEGYETVTVGPSAATYKSNTAIRSRRSRPRRTCVPRIFSE